MKSLHVFLTSVTDKTFCQTLTKKKSRCEKYQRMWKIFPMLILRMPGERRMRHATLSLCHFVSKKTFLCHFWATRERKRRGNLLPGGLPVYISHLTYCKFYINISHRGDLTEASIESSTNYHSLKCTYTNAQNTHTYCMYSTSMPPADLHRPPVRTDNKSMPIPACISYLVGTRLPLTFTYLTLKFGLILTDNISAKHFLKSVLLANFSQAGQKIWLCVFCFICVNKTQIRVWKWEKMKMRKKKSQRTL